MSKINPIILDKMFKFSGVDVKKLKDALDQIKSVEVDPEFRDKSLALNPTKNWCYVIAEFIYHCVAPFGSKAYRVVVPNDENNHYYVKWPNGIVVDLAADHLNEFDETLYAKGKECRFRAPTPSIPTRKLAKIINLDEE
jgi:hypothetical protein